MVAEMTKTGKYAVTSGSLNAAQWKNYLDTTLSPVIEKKLQMKLLYDGTWAGGYKDRRRKVLQIFYINEMHATFKWGWNFDFIPKQKGSRLAYARTDKQADAHIFELHPDFWRMTAARKATVISCSSPGNEQDVIDHLLPAIKRYYEATASYAAIIDNIDSMADNSYYNMINPERRIVKAYILAYLGQADEAAELIENMAFSSDKIKNEYLAKLRKI